ncbi:hypothetical protein Asppvi_002758 [Aspergillus pseudoviridinutans]|uniref:Uncharacterized protein n=1 Tax=Aspergillus pseudoviridinutans TaxID=1517512 RepID=A0A9P3B3F9_9EURO|nr:uncharacterized protein Asppvi_002758 [Aspergillus pseudoviridinutans]GIJ83926.1 hypothetical protein Asppvi_002758 [Aspergillus pseudoviridinutans]
MLKTYAKPKPELRQLSPVRQYSQLCVALGLYNSPAADFLLLRSLRLEYVKGDKLYMKIQKPGRACGGCMTPLKVKVVKKSRVAMCATGSSAWQCAGYHRGERRELYDEE